MRSGKLFREAILKQNEQTKQRITKAKTNKTNKQTTIKKFSVFTYIQRNRCKNS